MSRTTRFTAFLQQIVTEHPGTLRAIVAIEALERDNPDSFFRDLLSHGCSSGMISGLCYYADTHAFFDAHYDEINNLIQDDRTVVSALLANGSDLKNTLAWFAFEQTGYRLIDAFEYAEDCRQP